MPLPDYGQGTVRIEGARELRAALRKAGESLDDLKEAHRAAAEVVARYGSRFAPVRSGNLMNSIRASATVTAGIVRAGWNYKRAASYIPPPRPVKYVPYAGVIHWGAPTRHIKEQPFLSQAGQESEPIWLKHYYDTLEEALDTARAVRP